MLGMVGNDGFADFMHQFLSNQNINTSQIKRANCATGTAFIAVDKAGENSIIVIGAANAEISAETFDHFIFTENDILICQNEIPVSVMEHIFQKAKSANADIIYNPAPALSGTSDLIHWSDICIVNEPEYDFYKENLEGNNKTIIKTLGARGVEIFFDGRAERINGFQVNVLDTTGAGDCFTGALAARLSQGDNVINAAKYANKAAAISVQKKGASISMPSVKEIYEI